MAGVSRKEIVGMSELVVRLVLVGRSLERVRPRRGPDLSPHAVRATLHLFQHGQGTVGDLAEGLGVSMGWASRIADELERVGHVLRERDAHDRRIVRLRLSEGAIGLAEDMYRERGRVVAEALALLNREERGAVGRFLRALTEGLEALALSPPAPESSPPPPPSQ
jgi:DNA-binding MarR family transcriptional regulator